jgi:hypothetical protein
MPPALLVWGLFSLIFMVGSFKWVGEGSLDSFGLGVLMASFAANIILLHALFVLRSLRNTVLGG